MIFIGIAAGLFLLDYSIKNWVEKNLKDDLVKEVLGDRFLLRKYHNSGWAFEKGSESPRLVKYGTSICYLLLAAGYLWTLTRKGCHWIKLGGALLLGGGASNLADRILRGHVTDYLSLNTACKKIRSIVFNLSDVCVLLGAILVIVGALKRRS